MPESVRGRLRARELAVAEPFRGITTDGRVSPGLFPLRGGGTPTLAIRESGRALLASLTPEQRAQGSFPIDTDIWRRWSNVHRFLMRHGLLLDDLAEEPRIRTLDLLQHSLSARGFTTARNILKLNHTLGEMTDRLGDEYGEWLYWVSLMGDWQSLEPVGWQIDGHHLNVNWVLVGDQLVATPMFMGAEPVRAESGRYVGTGVLQDEEQRGAALMRSLTPEQQRRARVGDALPNDVLATAFRDNLQLGYDGIRAEDLSTEQRTLLLDLIQVYAGRLPAGYAEARMAEIAEHLADTYFTWIGGLDTTSVFYYRVHSPVVLIEFDHQSGVGFDNDEPSRHHIHTVVRTPNGNDYGKDLLRQHYQQVDHSHQR